jgi:hypothetical protein
MEISSYMSSPFINLGTSLNITYLLYDLILAEKKACNEPFGSETCRRAQVESLRAELLPSTCSGPELVEGSRVVIFPTPA